MRLPFRHTGFGWKTLIVNSGKGKRELLRGVGWLLGWVKYKSSYWSSDSGRRCPGAPDSDPAFWRAITPWTCAGWEIGAPTHCVA